MRCCVIVTCTAASVITAAVRLERADIAATTVIVLPQILTDY